MVVNNELLQTCKASVLINKRLLQTCKAFLLISKSAFTNLQSLFVNQQKRFYKPAKPLC